MPAIKYLFIPPDGDAPFIIQGKPTVLDLEGVIDGQLDIIRLSDLKQYEKGTGTAESWIDVSAGVLDTTTDPTGPFHTEEE